MALGVDYIAYVFGVFCLPISLVSAHTYTLLNKRPFFASLFIAVKNMTTSSTVPHPKVATVQSSREIICSLYYIKKVILYCFWTDNANVEISSLAFELVILQEWNRHNIMFLFLQCYRGARFRLENILVGQQNENNKSLLSRWIQHGKNIGMDGDSRR